MKRLFFGLSCLLVLVSLQGCGESVVDFSDLQRRGDVYIWSKNQKPYSGKFINYYRNGSVHQTGSMRNGRLHGELVTNRENGKTNKIETFREGVLNGKYSDYWFNSGRISWTGNFRNGKKHGEWKLHNNSDGGKVEIIQNYKDGELVTNH